MESTNQQIIGTKTYFFKKMCFFLIHVSTLALWGCPLYKLNHKQSRYVKEVLLSSEKLPHKFLHVKQFYSENRQKHGDYCSHTRLIKIMTHSKWHPKAPLSIFFCLEIAFLRLALLFDRWPRGMGDKVLVNAKLLLRSSASCSRVLSQADKDTTTFSEIWLPKNCQSETSSSIELHYSSHHTNLQQVWPKCKSTS